MFAIAILFAMLLAVAAVDQPDAAWQWTGLIAAGLLVFALLCFAVSYGLWRGVTSALEVGQGDRQRIVRHMNAAETARYSAFRNTGIVVGLLGACAAIYFFQGLPISAFFATLGFAFALSGLATAFLPKSRKFAAMLAFIVPRFNDATWLGRAIGPLRHREVVDRSMAAAMSSDAANAVAAREVLSARGHSAAYLPEPALAQGQRVAPLSSLFSNTLGMHTFLSVPFALVAMLIASLIPPNVFPDLPPLSDIFLPSANDDEPQTDEEQDPQSPDVDAQSDERDDGETENEGEDSDGETNDDAESGSGEESASGDPSNEASEGKDEGDEGQVESKSDQVSSDQRDSPSVSDDTGATEPDQGDDGTDETVNQNGSDSSDQTEPETEQSPAEDAEETDDANGSPDGETGQDSDVSERQEQPSNSDGVEASGKSDGENDAANEPNDALEPAWDQQIPAENGNDPGANDPTMDANLTESLGGTGDASEDRTLLEEQTVGAANQTDGDQVEEAVELVPSENVDSLEETNSVSAPLSSDQEATEPLNVDDEMSVPGRIFSAEGEAPQSLEGLERNDSIDTTIIRDAPKPTQREPGWLRRLMNE
ncbi:MAG: hypothetical protein ABJD13_10500 [Paracoccaceae bacterium]